ncbi:MAG: ABC transporter ATP-binding protein [Christensenellales bacterium]
MKKRTSRGVYRKLASFLKPYLPLILLALLFSTIQIAATLLSPVVVGKTIDYIIGEGNVDFGLIARNAIVLAALIATAMLFQYLASLALNAASYKSVRDLRTAAFDKLDRVPLGYIDSRSQGDIMARVGSDVDQISDGLIQGFTQFFSGIVTIAGTLVFMLSLNYVIAIVVVLVTPLSLVTAYFISKGCHNMFAGQAAKRGELSGLMTETLTAQRTMRLFGDRTSETTLAVINGELKVVGQNAAFIRLWSIPARDS